MKKVPHIKTLREIGWNYWDPINLRDIEEMDGSEFGCDDEYDTYLMQAAGQLINGKSIKEVTDYLVDIEQNYMGLGEGKGLNVRAEETVLRISNLIFKPN